MDKKNTTIGILLIFSAIGLLIWNTSNEANRAQQHAAAQPARVATPASTAAGPADATAGAVSSPVPTTPSAPPADTGNLPAAEAKIVTLENDTLRLNLTTRGGGIQTIALLKQADKLEHRRTPAENPYLFNADSSTPALALSLDDANGGSLREWTPAFEVVENVPGQRVVLEARLPDGGVVSRSYAFPADDNTDPHLVEFKTTFRAPASAAAPARMLRLNTGTLPPSDGDTMNQFLGLGTYDGDTFHKTKVDMLNSSSGFLGMGARGAHPYVLISRGSEPWQWVSVTNQFFAGIIRFDEATRAQVSSLLVRPAITKLDEKTRLNHVLAATGEIGINLPVLEPGQEAGIAATYYVGPREYSRLADLGGEQENAVQFGRLFWVISVDFLCKTFVVILNGLHSMLPESPWSWGFAIILLTVIIKAITWPLVSAQQRSAERMRHFQEPMKAIREKFKDDPKRMQQEMMKLYQEHKINPFAGCLPVLIQIPIFTGLFFTFQSLAQLRFQSFLWIPDLSMPDVIPGLETIGGFPIHILPVFMGATMLLNMRMTPMPNIEGQQKMIFYGMMIMFPIICYAMPAALMLYYSVQNCLTIVQTLVTRRRMRNEPVPTVTLPEPKKGKGKKKKK